MGRFFVRFRWNGYRIAMSKSAKLLTRHAADLDIAIR